MKVLVIILTTLLLDIVSSNDYEESVYASYMKDSYIVDIKKLDFVSVKIPMNANLTLYKSNKKQGWDNIIKIDTGKKQSNNGYFTNHIPYVTNAIYDCSDYSFFKSLISELGGSIYLVCKNDPGEISRLNNSEIYINHFKFASMVNGLTNGHCVPYILNRNDNCSSYTHKSCICLHYKDKFNTLCVMDKPNNSYNLSSVIRNHVKNNILECPVYIDETISMLTNIGEYKLYVPSDVITFAIDKSPIMGDVPNEGGFDLSRMEPFLNLNPSRKKREIECAGISYGLAFIHYANVKCDAVSTAEFTEFRANVAKSIADLAKVVNDQFKDMHANIVLVSNTLNNLANQVFILEYFNIYLSNMNMQYNAFRKRAQDMIDQANVIMSYVDAFHEEKKKIIEYYKIIPGLITEMDTCNKDKICPICKSIIAKHNPAVAFFALHNHKIECFITASDSGNGLIEIVVHGILPSTGMFSIKNVYLFYLPRIKIVSNYNDKCYQFIQEEVIARPTNSTKYALHSIDIAHELMANDFFNPTLGANRITFCDKINGDDPPIQDAIVKTPNAHRSFTIKEGKTLEYTDILDSQHQTILVPPKLVEQIEPRELIYISYSSNLFKSDITSYNSSGLDDIINNIDKMLNVHGSHRKNNVEYEQQNISIIFTSTVTIIILGSLIIYKAYKLCKKYSSVNYLFKLNAQNIPKYDKTTFNHDRYNVTLRLSNIIDRNHKDVYSSSSKNYKDIDVFNLYVHRNTGNKKWILELGEFTVHFIVSRSYREGKCTLECPDTGHMKVNEHKLDELEKIINSLRS